MGSLWQETCILVKNVSLLIDNLAASQFSSQSLQCLRLACDYRESMTGVIGICADGTVLKPAIIREGKTPASLLSILMTLVNARVHGLHSASGWMDPDVFIEYVRLIVLPVTRGEPSVLLLDCHYSHHHESVDMFLAANNMRILKVPEGMTAKHQPVDVGITGLVKSKLRRKWAQHQATLDNNWDEHDSIVAFGEAMSEVDATVVKSAFSRAIGAYCTSGVVRTDRSTRRRQQREESRQRVQQGHALQPLSEGVEVAIATVVEDPSVV